MKFYGAPLGTWINLNHDGCNHLSMLVKGAWCFCLRHDLFRKRESRFASIFIFPDKIELNKSNIIANPYD